uniref:Uncharacterized protein n=1 Tax=Anguilla anguilla TaxID=7936 RepID=A0A0E9PDG9_ANGAN
MVTTTVLIYSLTCRLQTNLNPRPISQGRHC